MYNVIIGNPSPQYRWFHQKCARVFLIWAPRARRRAASSLYAEGTQTVRNMQREKNDEKLWQMYLISLAWRKKSAVYERKYMTTFVSHPWHSNSMNSILYSIEAVWRSRRLFGSVSLFHWHSNLMSDSFFWLSIDEWNALEILFLFPSLTLLSLFFSYASLIPLLCLSYFSFWLYSSSTLSFSLLRWAILDIVVVVVAGLLNSKDVSFIRLSYRDFLCYHSFE